MKGEPRKRKAIKGNKPGKIKTTVYVTEPLLTAINEDAEKQGTNFSNVVESKLNDIYKT